MTIASAPPGTGAPVMMREQVPAVTVCSGNFPGDNFFQYRKFRAAFYEIGGSHSIAIDGRFIVRRAVDVAGNVCDQN